MKRKDVRTEQDRDRLLERWLGRGADASAGPGTCLDPETLAAWADGTLTRDERRRAESHAADCVRCQALVAAMVRTDPPRPQAATWRSRWPWLAPIAAGATAIALWVGVGSDVLRAPAPEPAKEVAAAPPRQDTAAVPLGQGVPKTARRAEPSDAQAGAAAPAPTAPAERRKAEAAAARGDVASNALGARQGFADALWTEIRSPDPNVRVRFTAQGRVERSTDAGATWTPQPIDPAVRLTSGSAPSADVCWLAGSAGNVLRSTDGRTWVRVPFPQMVDLVSVSATDANTAVVAASDGRRFETRDGGQTWSPSRLQETPGPAF